MNKVDGQINDEYIRQTNAQAQRRIYGAVIANGVFDVKKLTLQIL